MAREKFTIRLSDKEKSKYRKHVEDNTDFDSLSKWFRGLADIAVDSPTDDDTSVLDEDFLRTIIQSETRSIQTELSKLTDQLAELDEAIRTGDEVTELAEEAYLILTGREPQNIDQYPRERYDTPSEGVTVEGLAQNSGRPEAFAAYFGIDVEAARRVLVRAENMFPAIESDINRNGDRYWFWPDGVTHTVLEDVGDDV